MLHDGIERWTRLLIEFVRSCRLQRLVLFRPLVYLGDEQPRSPRVLSPHDQVGVPLSLPPLLILVILVDSFFLTSFRSSSRDPLLILLLLVYLSPRGVAY